MHVQKAHDDEITGLKFSSDGHMLFSRSVDATLKVAKLLIEKNIANTCIYGQKLTYKLSLGLGFATNEEASLCL